MIDDLERIFDELFGETTAWEIVAALVILVAAFPVAMLAGWVVKKLLLLVPGVSHGVATVGKNAARVVVVFIGLAWSLSVLNVGPGFILVFIVALLVAGLAVVQPVVQNLAAGAALPYRVDDQIETDEYQGTIVDITLRQTVLTTLDGRTVHILHREILASPITVFTKFEQRRSSIDLWIDYHTDIEDACRLLVETVSGLVGVHEEPAPYVIPSGFEDGRCRLRLMWWHDPDLRTQERMRGAVVTAVKVALDEAGIAIAPPAAIFISEP